MSRIALPHAAVSAAAALHPALMVMRAQQIAVTCMMVVVATFSLLSHFYLDAVITMAIPCLLLLLSLTSLVVAITFLVKTASPRARARSCRGSAAAAAPCMSYHCDFGWDVAMAVLWTCMLAGSLLDSPFSLSVLVVNAVLAELFITTAGLSGLVRKRLRQQALSDVEMASQQLGAKPAGSSSNARPTGLGGAHEPL